MRLCLVDLSSIFWATWHAVAGQDVDAASRVSLERTRSYVDGYDAVCVCCDVGRTWRHELYPQYKANRPQRDAAAYDQLRRVREQLEADGVPVVSVDGFEADDVIATLACKAPAAGYEVVIVSGDKDLCQLVGPTVTVQSTNNGGTLYTAEKVREKFRVDPSQLGDFLALAGDKSDNVAGLPGCGEVNAARLLNELGSLAAMLEAPDGVTPPKMREALVANRQQVLLARKLVQLRIDVPIDFAEAIAPRERKVVIEGTFEDAPDVDDAPKDRPSSPPPQNSNGSGSSLPRPITGATDNSGPTPSTALVLDRNDPSWMLALEPRGLKQLQWFANQLHESGMYRKFANPQAIEAAILRGRSLGLDMMTSLDVINVIKGKPTMGAMAIVGRCLASGKAEYFEPIESSSTAVVWETKRVGRPAKRHSYTIEDAHIAGLDKPSKEGEPSNYIKRPKPMLLKQCAVELARMVYPDVVCNLYDQDEFEPR